MVILYARGKVTHTKSNQPMVEARNPPPYQMAPNVPVSVPLSILLLIVVAALHPAVLYVPLTWVLWVLDKVGLAFYYYFFFLVVVLALSVFVALPYLIL